MAPTPPLLRDPAQTFGRPQTGWRLRLYIVIFEADTRAGRLFDLALIGCILASVAAVVLDSMASVSATHGSWLGAVERFFTLAFSVEYIARLVCVRRP